jgi:ABC-2 type transport system permease protein
MITSPTTSMTPAGRHAIGPWRVEWLRLFRTPRWIALFGVYLVFGLLGPVTAKYLADILQRVQSEMTIIVPAPQPSDGVVNYLGQVTQTGLVVVVVIAAGSLAFDSRRGVAVFLRTRTSNMWSLLAPRLSVPLAAAVAAYAVGLLAAWYETALLLGPLPFGAMLGGLICQAVYLAFVIAVVAAAAAVTRGVLPTVGTALGALIVMSVAGSVSVVHRWLPSTLAGAQAELLTTATLSDFVPALIAAAVAGAALTVFAVDRLGRRQL